MSTVDFFFNIYLLIKAIIKKKICHLLSWRQSSIASSKHFFKKICSRLPYFSSSRMLSLLRMILDPRILFLHLRTPFPYLSFIQLIKVSLFLIQFKSLTVSISSILVYSLINLFLVRLQKHACLNICLSNFCCLRTSYLS